MTTHLKPLGSSPDFEVNVAWDVQRLWDVARLRTEKKRTDLNLLSVFLGRGVIPYGEGGGQVHKPSVDLSTYQVVYPGDLVLNNQQAWRGSVGVSSHLGIISPAYIVLTLSSKLNPKFANYLFQSKVMVEQFVTASKGVGDIQRDIHTPWLKNTRVPLPPLPEQTTIVRFLDHTDQRVQRYIHVKQKLAKLLEEQKQVIIHHAVTRGLDQNVNLKPSSVEWLGDVPEHWEVSRSRRLFSPRTELARPDDVQLSATQAYGVIPQAEFEEKVSRRVVKISMHLEKRRHVEKDDFVISMRSFQGGLERAWASGCIRSSYVVLKPSADVDVGFFTYLFKSYGYIRALQATANFIRDGQDLNFGNFCLVDLPLPPLSEQKTIAESLNASTANVDASIKRARAEIELLREYRTRLISDVVTGKLDVRDAAANLPDIAGDEDECTPEVLGDGNDSGEEFSDLSGESDED